MYFVEMENVSMEHTNTQEETDLISELYNNGLSSQHNLTVTEIVNAMADTQIHTCQQIVQIILEDRRRIRRETLSQTVKDALKNRKSQLSKSQTSK